MRVQRTSAQFFIGKFVKRSKRPLHCRLHSNIFPYLKYNQTENANTLKHLTQSGDRWSCVITHLSFSHFGIVLTVKRSQLTASMWFSQTIFCQSTSPSVYEMIVVSSNSQSSRKKFAKMPTDGAKHWSRNFFNCYIIANIFRIH